MYNALHSQAQTNAGFVAVLLLLASMLMPSCADARNDRAFPQALVADDDGRKLRLSFTGESERVFLLFRIYAIAHYAEVEGRSPLAVDSIVMDGRSKALAIRFKRTLGAERIRDEFADSIRRNARHDWLATAQPTIDAFMAAIDRDARAGDELIFFWLEGGRLLAEFNGDPAFEATDTAFARLIWSIWFGDDPVCDRDELLAQATPEGML